MAGGDRLPPPTARSTGGGRGKDDSARVRSERGRKKERGIKLLVCFHRTVRDRKLATGSFIEFAAPGVLQCFSFFATAHLTHWAGSVAGCYTLARKHKLATSSFMPLWSERTRVVVVGTAARATTDQSNGTIWMDRTHTWLWNDPNV